VSDPAPQTGDLIAEFERMLTQNGSRDGRVRAVLEFLRAQGRDLGDAAERAFGNRQKVEGGPRESWFRRAADYVGALPAGTQRLLVGALVTLATILGVHLFPGSKPPETARPPETVKSPDEDPGAVAATVRQAVREEMTDSPAARFFAAGELEGQIRAAANKIPAPAEKDAVNKHAPAIAAELRTAWDKRK
jgi:hypothetical protein